jgi:hypothetical protein
MSTTDTVYNDKIITPIYAPSKKNIDLMTSEYIKTNHDYNFKYPSIDGTNLNFTHILYQKKNNLHDAKDNVFNSCIYTNSRYGETGCSNTTINLNKEYFIKNQNYNKNVMNYLSNDINILNTKYL